MSYKRRLQEKDKQHQRVVKSLKEGKFKKTAKYTKVASQCLKKVGYSSYRQAERVTQSPEVIARGVSLRIYECPFCNLYHITKKALR